jgi:GNAT superfamily N-acetyltransferase
MRNEAGEQPSFLIPSPTMQILRATPEEAPVLKAIMVEAKAHWGYPAEWMARWLELVRITPTYLRNALPFKAVDAGEAIGWYALVQGHKMCLLDHLWVTPSRIGTGVGRALLTHALAEARRVGARYVKLEAEPHALGFYQHMGAHQVGVVLSGMDREIPVMQIDLE